MPAHRSARLAAGFLLGLVAAMACAQGGYPSKSVRVVVPWPPGQATDLSARLVAQQLSQTLGQSLVIDNRPGAGGVIGSDIVAKAPADGYTLLAASSGPISIAPHVQSVPYDPEKSFAPIALIGIIPFALVSTPSFPASTIKEFIAQVRASPGKYKFASSGTGATAHLIAEYFNSLAGLQAIHVPYKGSVPALTDVINGSVDYALETVAATLPYIKSGRLKAFGVTSLQRLGAAPELPPIAEAAELPGYVIGGWVGYMAPAGTPAAIRLQLSAEVQKAIRSPELRERFSSIGMEASASTPDELGAFTRREFTRYGDIVKKANIRLD